MKRGRRSTRRSASAKKTAAPVIAEPSRGANGDRDPLSDLLALLIAALLLARLLVPTEAAALGETLWIAQLWLAAALVWFWRQARNGAYRITGGWIDLAVWTLVAGHLVSGAIVLCTEGDKRAALNVMWEWVALGVMFFLVRTGASTRWARSSLTLAFCATAIALAGLGVWQYYVWYPQTASQYDAMRSELDTLLERAQTGRLTPDDADRLEQLQGEFIRQQIPLEGPERLLWEQRLKASREPFGLFALANTFAGLLLVWLLVLIDWAVTGSGQTRQNVSRCAGIALVAGCLLLTKSRTAWVGLLSGLVLWGGLKLRGYERPARIRSARANESASGERPQEAFFRRWHLAALVVFLAAVVGAAVIASQGLDRLVITEAPKSLRYRFEYWQGTLRILKEHPWFGTGPGNFRQHYLRYKLAGSSEEIADPHNLFLDVWANAGVIGLVGLLGLLIGGGIRLFRSEPENETTASDDTSPPAFCRDLWLVGAAAGFLLVLGYEWLLDATADLRLPVLLIGAVLAAALMGRPTLTQCGWAAAMAGLGVHLLGAGGIEMPAIVQTLLVIVILGTATPLGGGRPASGSPAAARRSWPFWTATGLTAAAFLGCLLTATLPVLQRR
ncbi:MAG: O-antigen ligase family protein, partial [Planctomycetes bacterium]|nr:O-antigen ligase family protein [Planctomycetota bacterium]